MWLECRCWKLAGGWGEVWGGVHWGPSFSLCCSGLFTMFLGLGSFLDGLVCQIVLLRIGQKLLNDNYSFGTHGIQQIPRGRRGPSLEPYGLQPGRQTTNSKLSQKVNSLRTGMKKMCSYSKERNLTTKFSRDRVSLPSFPPSFSPLPVAIFTSQISLEMSCPQMTNILVLLKNGYCHIF